MSEAMEKALAADAVIDKARPGVESKGVKRLYHVGLVAEAPFEYIDVPTVILRGTVRGKCVNVPKKTGEVSQGPNNVLIHRDGMVAGRFEELYDIEVKGFIQYCDTHIFRKTSEYEVPITENGRATGAKKKMWRAEIEAKDPGQQMGGRSLHESDTVQAESISKYVWIVPAQLDSKQKPVRQGAQSTIAEARAAGGFFADKTNKDPKDPKKPE